MAFSSAVSAFLMGGGRKKVPAHQGKAKEQQAANKRLEAIVAARLVHKALDEAVDSDSPEASIASLWNKRDDDK
jgi:hypothetical protein